MPAANAVCCGAIARGSTHEQVLNKLLPLPDAGGKLGRSAHHTMPWTIPGIDACSCRVAWSEPCLLQHCTHSFWQSASTPDSNDRHNLMHLHSLVPWAVQVLQIACHQTVLRKQPEGRCSRDLCGGSDTSSTGILPMRTKHALRVTHTQTLYSSCLRLCSWTTVNGHQARNLQTSVFTTFDTAYMPYATSLSPARTCTTCQTHTQLLQGPASSLCIAVKRRQRHRLQPSR